MRYVFIPLVVAVISSSSNANCVGGGVRCARDDSSDPKANGVRCTRCCSQKSVLRDVTNPHFTCTFGLGGCSDGHGPPGSDVLTLGYNLLSGVPLTDPNVIQYTSVPLFTLTGSKRRSSSWTDIEVHQCKEFEKLIKHSSIECSRKVSEVSASNTVRNMKESFESSSGGYDRSFTGSVEYKGAGVESTVRAALLSGSSSSMMDSRTEANNNYEYSAYSTSRGEDYTVSLALEDITNWSPKFKQACEELGSEPNAYKMIKFFKAWGTHIMIKATFGSLCVSQVSVKSEMTLVEVRKETSSSDFEEIAFMGFEKNKKEAQTALDEETKGKSVSSKLGIHTCSGGVTFDTDCGAIKGTPKPVFRVTMKPIWDLDLDFMSVSSKRNMKQFWENDIIEAGSACNCGNGYCAPKTSLWSLPIQADVKIGDLFDRSKCLCDNDYFGVDCGDKTNHIAVRKGPFKTKYPAYKTFCFGDRRRALYTYSYKKISAGWISITQLQTTYSSHPPLTKNARFGTPSWFNVPMCKDNEVVVDILVYKSEYGKGRTPYNTSQVYCGELKHPYYLTGKTVKLRGWTCPDGYWINEIRTNYWWAFDLICKEVEFRKFG